MPLPPTPETSAQKRSLHKPPSKKSKVAQGGADPSKKNTHTPTSPKNESLPDPSQHFTAAVELLRRLVQEPEVQQKFQPNTRTNSQMVYTNGVTLWMLVLQRLGNGLSLEETVSHVIQHDRDIFPENKRIQDGTLSENSSAYNKARQRLSTDAIHEFSQAVCDSLGRNSKPVFGSQRVFILDGTTITLAPTPELQLAFPPATNQHGESVWPVALLMVAHELQSGCAVLPEVGAMYGPNNSSEAKRGKLSVNCPNAPWCWRIVDWVFSA